jgi:Protein of unknown function (DUF3638)/Protein of unknown function (DUF3645)
LDYKAYDGGSGIYLDTVESHFTLRHWCLAHVDDLPYKVLQESVNDTSHTPNEIIAEQSHCPAELDIFEYHAFRDIRSGYHLQWQKLLRECASPYLNFTAPATHALILHAILQCGPSLDDEVRRMTHVELANTIFCRRLVDEVDGRFEAVKANWQEATSVKILILILLRIRSLSDDRNIKEECERILLKLRHNTLKWISQLQSKMHSSTESEETQRWSGRLLETALICRTTIWTTEISDGQISSGSLYCFALCGILIHDHKPHQISSLHFDLQAAILVDHKICHALEAAVQSAIQLQPSALERAIGCFWPGQHNFGSWTVLSAPNERWISAKADPLPGYCDSTCHFNILEGKLLINGHPVGRLPDCYRQSELFQRIFGHHIFTVCSSNAFGMAYMSTQSVKGHEIHFGMRDGNVVIKTKKEEWEEIVSPDIFKGSPHDIPKMFIENFFHVFNPCSGMMEFRPIADLWYRHSDCWILDVNQSKMSRAGQFLIEPQSDIGDSVHQNIEPFEAPENIVISYNSCQGVKVTLPRFQTAFAVNPCGQLVSQDLGLTIADDQDIGTMYGLRGGLVLSDSSGSRDARILIVPQGKFQLSLAQQGHSIVTVSTEPLAVVKYSKYRINSVLARLDDSGQQLDILMQAYLHAVTSHVLPDPLTGRCGSEQALLVLDRYKASLWRPVSLESVEILQLISDLTPKREYYPPHLMDMQTVHWNPNLRIVSQQDRFFFTVQSIIAWSNTIGRFQPDPASVSLESSKECHLLERSYLRNKLYCPPEEAGPAITFTSSDRIYEPRDRGNRSTEGLRALECASLISRWCPNMDVSRNIWAHLKGMRISGYGESFDVTSLSDTLSLDVVEKWGSLYELCRKATYEDIYRLMFIFATVAYGCKVDLSLIRTLVLVAIQHETLTPRSPPWSTYHLCWGLEPLQQKLRSTIAEYAMPYSQPPGYRSPQQQQNDLIEEERYETQVQEERERFLRHIMSQWPCERPTLNYLRSINFHAAGDAVEAMGEWSHYWYPNHRLHRHIIELQTATKPQSVPSLFIAKPIPKIQETEIERRSSRTIGPRLQDLLQKIVAQLPPTIEPWFVPVSSGLPNGRSVPSLIVGLEKLVAPMLSHSSLIRKQSGRKLQHSIDALARIQEDSIAPDLRSVSVEDINSYERSCEQLLSNSLDQIKCSLNKHSMYRWLQHSGLWPVITTEALLRFLRSDKILEIPLDMVSTLLGYGLSVTALQRAKRLRHAVQNQRYAEFAAENSNRGHHNWDVRDHPYWLLLEIEGNFLIRPNQFLVAQEMISPKSGQNSCIQLIMGGGKSSVIVPMVAVVLADRQRLFRLVVPRSLLAQMAGTLVPKICGTLGRPVLHLPFSRDTPIDGNTITAYKSLHCQCKDAGGVLLALPEHIMSFKLRAWDMLSSGRYHNSHQIRSFQTWLDRNCRDVLDECDHILDVKSQLVYPTGTQVLIEGHPDRWTTAQQLLNLVKNNCLLLKKLYPDEILVQEKAGGGFPIISFCSSTIEEKLQYGLVKDIRDGLLPNLSFADCPEDQKEAASEFVSSPHCDQKSETILRDCFDGTQTMSTLLVLRGLLAHQVLFFVLRKRWNVNYGLHPTRCLISVPYRAKGIPSANAEFGHTEVAIALTCLSYYYTGIKLGQLRMCLEKVLGMDDPSQEMESWTQSAESLPTELRSWRSINLKDHRQLEKLHQHLRYNMSTVNFFLNYFVFPREAKCRVIELAI